MEKQVDKKFTWVIKDFSSLPSEIIYSDTFVIDGCKWRILAYPKRNISAHDLSLYIDVPYSEYLPSGWRRHAQFSLTVVNQITEQLSKQIELQHWFKEEEPDCGTKFMFPFNKLYGGFLVNGELKIVAEVNVLEVVGKLDVIKETSLVKESIDVNGFQVFPSQVEVVNRLFDRYPDVASNFQPKNPHLKTAYMNILLSSIEILRQSPQKISKDDLVDAYAALRTMTDVGFKLDWLEKKLKEVSEKKEKEETSENQIQEIEKELKDFKQKCSDLETLLWKKKTELLASRALVLCDDFL